MGKLEAVRTTESFAERVEKSGILTAKQLEQAKKALRAPMTPAVASPAVRTEGARD